MNASRFSNDRIAFFLVLLYLFYFFAVNNLFGVTLFINDQIAHPIFYYSHPRDNVPTAADGDLERGKEGVSACLLIKDGNGRLIEWLAYH